MFKRLQITNSRQFTARRHAWARLAAFLLLAVVLPVAIHAATFTVSFDQDTITLGDSVTMTMSFEGGSPNAVPAPPPVAGLRIEDAHSDMTSMQIVNGQMSQKTMHTFQVTPLRPGEFVIPSISATINGQVCKSDPFKLIVSKPGAPPAGVTSDNPDVAFMRLQIPKTNVYVGEVIRAELQIYLRDGIVKINDFQLNPPEAAGFTVGKTSEVQHRETRIGNYRYTIVPLAMTFTSAKAGTLSLGEAQASLNLMFGPLNFFGQPMRSQRVTLTNPPVIMQVLPLPGDNVPPGFSGAVGNYSMTLDVSPTNVAVGDPITVKVDIRGRGAVDAVRLPQQMGWDQFKVYPPTSEFQAEQNDPLAISGSIHFALTVVPENLDVKELPPFVFTYFDPDRKTYKTLSHPAVPLVVRPSAASLPPPSISSGNSSDNPPPVMDVSPIKPRLGALAQLAPPLVMQPWFLALQAIPALAWVSLLIRRQQKERLANNPRLRRQKQVEQTIHAGLKELHRSANAGESETFFATVFHLLQERLGERLDLPASAITEAVLDERVRPMGAPDEQLNELRELFQACNQARYARETSNAELISLIPKVESALNGLKRMQA